MSSQRPNPPEKRPVWPILAFAALLLLLILIGLRLFQPADHASLVGESPEDFSLTTFSGERIETQALRGKVILVNFWASWCTTCDEEALLLEQAWQMYQDRGQVVFLGIAYMDTEPASLDFIQTYHLSYPHGQDLRGAISDIYRVSAVPETYILDAAGKVAFIKMGPFTFLNEITDVIDQLLLD